MDFVEGLGDTSGILEIAVDGIGRAEILNDRVRLTLITQRDCGPAPAVCLVWTTAGLKQNRPNYDLLNEVLTGRIKEPTAIQIMDGVAVRH